MGLNWDEILGKSPRSNREPSEILADLNKLAEEMRPLQKREFELKAELRYVQDNCPHTVRESIPDDYDSNFNEGYRHCVRCGR